MKKIIIVAISSLVITLIGIFISLVYPSTWKNPKNPIYSNVNIKIEDDKNKLGKVYSRLFGGGFYQYPKTSGISENVIKVNFNHNAEILGFIASLDHSRLAFTIVEVAATVNTKWGYTFHPTNNAIIHTSFWASQFYGGVRKTDQKVMFTPGYGIALKKGDSISIGAVVENMSVFTKGFVSPEFVIYYRWLR